MDSESSLLELNSLFPCRSTQIDQLYNLFGHKEELPDSLYIYGTSSSGKSIVITSVLRKFSVHHTIINLIECCTAKVLYESILRNLCYLENFKCENMMDFIDLLQKHSTSLKDNAVIVLDKAEKLLKMEPNLLPGLLTISQLSDLPICTILISELPLQKFYTKTGILEVPRIHFPQYHKKDLLEILSLDYEIMKLQVNKIDFDLEFYRNYLNIFLSVFYRICRDISELRYTAKKNFIIYCEPIITGQIRMDNSIALWRNISPIFKQMSQSIYLRIDSDCQPEKVINVELPFYAKYLLIAAYLASYNPAKDDKRMFMKYHGKNRKTAKDVQKKSRVAEMLNTQLGPKTFSLDRLLAIFYAILDDKVGFNNNFLVQISSLVKLQLLCCLSDNMSLDSPKYKCTVNFDFILTISKMVGFNIRKYLSDFNSF